MNTTRSTRRVTVSADGEGVVSHAGAALLRETAERTGLVDAVTAVLADTYRGPWLHAPGQVFADLAVAIADGATRCRASRCSGTGRSCSGRWPRCPPPGAAWTASTPPTCRVCRRPGRPLGDGRGRPAPNPTCPP